MGPLPKRKFSHGRTHRRRAHHAIEPMQLVACDNCGEKKPPHIVCPSCGYRSGSAARRAHCVRHGPLSVARE